MNVTYDSRNRVVRRLSPNGTLNLTYSGWNLIEERNGGGELEQTYVHGAGVDEMLVKISASGPAYYHHDGLGSTIALTGESGELLESYRYDAFGGVSVMNASGLSLQVSGFQNRFLFTGREWLGQAGIYDCRNRVYSASLGRFLQTDPIRFSAGDVNLYRYVGNSPLNWVDPLGLCTSVPVYNPGLVNNNVLGGDYASNLPGGTDPGANFDGLGIAALGAAAIATGGEALVAAAPSMGGLATAGYNGAAGAGASFYNTAGATVGSIAGTQLGSSLIEQGNQVGTKPPIWGDVAHTINNASINAINGISNGSNTSY